MALTIAERELLSNIREQVGQIHEAVYGNGSPEKGIAVRVGIIEAQGRSLATACENNVKGLGEMTTAVTALTHSVDSHHKSVHLHGLFRSPKFWGYGTLAFIFVNLAIDAFRPEVLALIKAWTGVSIP